MKFKKHHNNKAYRSTKNGKRYWEVKAIAKRLGVKFGTIKEEEPKLKENEEPDRDTSK